MVVYWDLWLLSTLSVHTSFVHVIQKRNHLHLRLFQKLFGLILAVISLCLFFLPKPIFFYGRFFMGFLIGFITFYTSVRQIKQTLRSMLLYFLGNVCFVGLLFVLGGNNLLFFLLSLCASLFMIGINRIGECTEKIKKNIHFEGINRSFSALIDSGNFAMYHNRSIAFIKKKYLSNYFCPIGVISIDTITSSKTFMVYEGPPILEQKEQYYYVFIDSLPRDVLLGCEGGKDDS
jgi:hypothetical protein